MQNQWNVEPSANDQRLMVPRNRGLGRIGGALPAMIHFLATEEHSARQTAIEINNCGKSSGKSLSTLQSQYAVLLARARHVLGCSSWIPQISR